MKAEKIRQLQEEGLRFYEPHAAQLEFHQSLAGIRAAFGGNQSGKTYCGAVDGAWTVGKCHPYRPNYVGLVKGRDCCVSFGTIKAVLLPTYYKLLPRQRCSLGFKTFEGKEAIWPGLRGSSWSSAWSEIDKMLHLDDGSFMEFKSYEQGREAFQGSQIHWIRMDEEPPEDIFGENYARQITLRTNLVFTLTPLNYSQWLYSRVYQQAANDKNVSFVMMSSEDNPFSNREVLDGLMTGIEDEAIREARLHGKFTFLSGLVYKEYGDHNLYEPFPIPHDWHRSVVIDPHPEKPTAVNWLAEDYTGRVYCYREADLTGDVNQICDEIISRCSGEHIDLWLIDPSAKQSAGIRGKGRLIDEFRVRIRGIIEANNNRELGWDVVRQAVKWQPNGSRLVISRGCPVTDHQMRNYMWRKPLKTGEDRTKPEVHKKNDDHCDCVRYRMMWRSQATGSSFSGWSMRGYAN